MNNYFAAYHLFVALNEAMDGVVEADPTVLPAAMSALPSDLRMIFFELKELFASKDLGANHFETLRASELLKVLVRLSILSSRT